MIIVEKKVRKKCVAVPPPPPPPPPQSAFSGLARLSRLAAAVVRHFAPLSKHPGAAPVSPYRVKTQCGGTPAFTPSAGPLGQVVRYTDRASLYKEI